MLAAGIPDKDIPAQMTRDFGFSHWPQLLRGIAYVVGWGAMLLAAAVLIVSRRNTYGLHILRGSLGVGVFALSLMMLVRSLQGSWAEAAWLPDALAVPGGDLIRHGEPPIQPGDGPVRIDVENGGGRQLVQVRRGARDAEAERVARAVERYVESAHLQPQALPVAGAVALLGLVLMCWPARSAREVVASPAAPMRPAPENA
jgi:hypothetical protein